MCQNIVIIFFHGILNFGRTLFKALKYSFYSPSRLTIAIANQTFPDAKIFAIFHPIHPLIRSHIVFFEILKYETMIFETNKTISL